MITNTHQYFAVTSVHVMEGGELIMKIVQKEVNGELTPLLWTDYKDAEKWIETAPERRWFIYQIQKVYVKQ